jgi:hypothetical protein
MIRAVSGDRGARALRRGVFAASILLAPLVLIPGTIVNPAIGGIGNGAANIAANAAANPLTNQLHVATYVLETFLLPLSVLGLVDWQSDARPGLPRSEVVWACLAGCHGRRSLRRTI